MSKKSRRNRAKYRVSGKKTEREIIKSAESSKSISETKTPVSSIPSKISQTPALQYKYVIAELRNIGIITGAFAIILIILTFVLG